MVQNDAGQIEVLVHQLAKEVQGNILFDGMAKHSYTLQDDLIARMGLGSEIVFQAKQEFRVSRNYHETLKHCLQRDTACYT